MHCLLSPNSVHLSSYSVMLQTRIWEIGTPFSEIPCPFLLLRFTVVPTKFKIIEWQPIIGCIIIIWSSQKVLYNILFQLGVHKRCSESVKCYVILLRHNFYNELDYFHDCFNLVTTVMSSDCMCTVVSKPHGQALNLSMLWIFFVVFIIGIILC